MGGERLVRNTFQNEAVPPCGGSVRIFPNDGCAATSQVTAVTATTTLRTFPFDVASMI